MTFSNPQASRAPRLQTLRTILFSLTLGAGVAAQAQTGMVSLPGGQSISRGDYNDGNQAGDAPETTVSLNPFLIDSNLVTYAEWAAVYAFAINNGFTFANAGTGANSAAPVSTISWNDAVKWCNARTLYENATYGSSLGICYFSDPALSVAYTDSGTVYVNWSATGYRLPTEAEWEYAARGNLSGQRFPLGMDIGHYNAPGNTTNTIACYTTEGIKVSYDLGPLNIFPTGPVAVGSFPANGYGLFDMAGNLQEWCWDYYSKSYYLSLPANNPNPSGPTTGVTRVLRGGDWSDGPGYCRCAFRNSALPSAGHNVTGFRCVIGNANLQPPNPSQAQIIDFDPAQFIPAVTPTGLTYPTNFTLTATSSPLDPAGTSVTFQTINAAGIAYIDALNVLWITNSGTFTVTASEPLVPNFNGTGTNYLAASTNLTFTVTNSTSITVNDPATNTILFSPAPALVYGSTSPLTASATAGTPAFSVVPANIAVILPNHNLVIKGVGGFTVTASVPAMTNSGTSYFSNSVSWSFASTPAPLTITAISTNRLFGAANPAFTVADSGFVNGDTSASVFTGPPALATAATSTSLPGSFLITNASGWPFKGGVTNYLVTFVPGILTINAKTNFQSVRFLAAQNATNLVYGTNISLIATTVPSGGTVAFAISNLTAASIASITDNTDLWVTGLGKFRVVASAPTVSLGGTNYLAASSQLDFVAKGAPLTLTANNTNRLFNTPNPAFTFTAAGFANNDTWAGVFTSEPTLATTATTASKVGNYPITIVQGPLKFLGATNYTLKFVSGNLNIYTNPGVLDLGKLTSFIGSQTVSLADLNFVLTHYSHTGAVNLTALANLLGSDTLDTNGLQLILTNNYAHPAVADPQTLADFLGAIGTDSVDTNDLNVFMDYYPAGGTAVANAVTKVLGAPGSVADPAGLNGLLAPYITWPGTPKFTNAPPYIAACAGGAGQTNYCFTIANFNFTVQFSPDLTHWTNLESPGQILFTDPNAPVRPGGFYRLLNSTASP